MRAVDEADTDKAIEQFEAAIYYAQDQLAADRDIADLWEHLTAAYIADGQFRRAWDATARWDKILAANAAQTWAPEQQLRRDQMTRLLFEQTRKTSAEDRGEQDSAGDPTPRTAPEPSAQPVPDLVPAGDPAPPIAAETSERPAPHLIPAGEPVQTVAAPPGKPAPEPTAEPTAEPIAEPIAEPTSYGIHLASFSNQANAHKSWTQLQAQHPDLLNGKTLALRSVELGDRGTFVRVIAVPYATPAAARAACRDLQRRAQYCTVLQPG